jgi:hypothetical protein
MPLPRREDVSLIRTLPSKQIHLRRRSELLEAIAILLAA